MAKTSGMGDQFYIAGVDVSGDTQSLQQIACPLATFDDTTIDLSGNARLGGLRSGHMQFTTFFNDAAGASFQTLKALPTADVRMSYFRGTTLGNAAASITAKQLNHDATRGADGSFTFTCDAQSTGGIGLEWGQMLTAGKKTDTVATNGTGVDQAASTSFGWAAYLHVFAFTGTSVTVTLQDSADNLSFLGFTGSAFTAASGVTSERIAGATTSTVRRYVRAVTTGTFSSATFAVNFIKFTTAQT